MHGGNRTRDGDDSSGGIEVLYVDDKSDMLDVAAQLLEAEAREIIVDTASSPAEALDRLKDYRYDCVVSDYQMFGMDGVELLEAVRQDHDDLPFVLFTGRGSEEVASEAISAGVTDYLRKEGNSDEYAVLAQQIRTAVERRRAIERFEGFLEAAPDAYVIVDVDGVIEQVNTQAEELFGYERSEMLGETVEKLLPERYRDDHVSHRRAYVSSPETRPMGADVDLYGLRKDDSEFPVDIALSPVRIGGRLEVMAAIRDISTRKWREEELREREARLRRQNDRLEEFASVVSHDLRNPMTVVEGSLELARRTGERRHIDRAQDALGRMQSLVDDLLKLAREGMGVEELEPIHLERVSETAWTTAETGSGRLRVHDADELLADRGRLRQMLENLFHNAVEHGATDDGAEPADGIDSGGLDESTIPDAGDEVAADGWTHDESDGTAVTVRVGRFEEGFYVADDGSGIPPDKRDTVFEYGYSTGETGTGFGLAIVKRIAEAHGWDVSVTESRDGGARFEVTGVEWAN